MFIDFICNHAEIIVAIVLVVVSFILTLVKKKPVNSIIATIFDLCIKAVNIVESSSVLGSDQKLAFALNLVHNFLEEMYPGIQSSQYDSVITKTIEEILSTPHKK